VRTDKTLLRQLLLSGVLAAGFLPVWAALGVWILSVIQDAEGGQPLTRLEIQPGGTPLLVDYANGKSIYRDLDGKAVSPPDRKAQPWGTGPTYLAAKPRLTENVDNWLNRIRTFADVATPATFWYLMTDGRADGTAYLVGFDRESKRRVGFIGTAGFREDAVPANERFPFSGPTAGHGSRIITPPGLSNGPTQHPQPYSEIPTLDHFVSAHELYILGRDHTLYHIDLHKRAVETALQGTSLVSGALAVVASRPSPDNRLLAYYTPVVRTEEAILVLDSHGREQRRFSIPESLRDRGLFFMETSSGGTVMYAGGEDDGFGHRSDYHIFQIARDGRLRETKVELPDKPIPWIIRYGIGVSIPAPSVLAGFCVAQAIETQRLVENGSGATYSAAIARMLAESFPSFAIALIVSIALAVLCFRRLMRYGAGTSERVVWALFVLLLGLPGWIGFRFGRTWPVLEACPSCGRLVPRDRETCVRCADAFPRPALKGTEVFA
jgi:hypothetical protein